MAATGLPEAREDHAVVMTKFARRCLFQLRRVVQHLDRQLGPGTADITVSDLPLVSCRCSFI